MICTVPYVELILFLIYLALGPLVWLLYGVMLYAGRRRMLLMKRPPHPLVGPPPSVSIIIPAKDEGPRIRDCLASALGQDYPHTEVVAIDDRSTDETGPVMDDLAATHANLHVLHLTEPPAHGWTGKNRAVHEGAQRATGEWLLFVDSDVILEPDALSVALSVVKRKSFDMLSLLPRLESHSLWESLVVPLAAGTAGSMYLIALNNTQRLRSAFANGQFILIRRDAYDAIGGHEAMKDRFCEDIEMARQLKRRGLRPRVSWGTDFAAVRMYSNLPAIIRGWARIYYAADVGRPWRMLLAMLFILACCFTAYPAIAWGLYRTLVHPGEVLWGYLDSTWLGVGIVHLGMLTWFIAALYHWSGNPRRNALLFPLGGSILLASLALGIKRCITGKVEWRGTAYTHAMADLSGKAGETPPSNQPQEAR